MQRCGVDEVSAAFDAGEEISLLLVRRDSQNPGVARLRAIAEERGIPVREGSSSDVWRMARDTRDETPEVLALVGRNPDASLEEVLERGGLVWMLAGARYPVNIGFTIRTAEVSGADAVFVDCQLSHSERKAALRASMKAHRFMPVHWVDGSQAIDSAKISGFRVISVEDSGQAGPWDADLTGDVMLIVGGEHDGIPDDMLAASDLVVRIPMSGFVPSYNLQAPMAVVAIEAQRQRADGD